MKKIVLASVAVMALVSCKKDYTCDCTTTYTGNGQSTSSSSQLIVKDVSKKTVKNLNDCVSYETKYTNQLGEISTEKVDCSIEKY